MKKLFLMMMLAAAVTLGYAQSGGDDAFMTIEVDGFHHTLENSGDDCVLLDVRTPEEYKEGHLKGAINIDVKDSVNFKKKALVQLPKDKTVMVYCRSGRRSANAAGILAAEGYMVFSLEGGILAWKEAGKEIEK